MNHDITEQLGLTSKEFEVYKTLLQLGNSPVVSILKATQDHPQVVYRALDSLEAKGLVLSTIKQHKKYVQAETPHALAEIAKNRAFQVQKIIPELLALQKNSKDAIVRIYQGVEGVRQAREHVYRDMKEGDTYYIIGGSGDRYYRIMGKRLIHQIEQDRIKKKIWKRMVTFENQRELLKTHDPYKEYAEVRFLSENFPVLASTSIYGDNVLIYIFTENPIVILIESSEVAESYVHNFEILWKSAKE